MNIDGVHAYGAEVVSQANLLGTCCDLCNDNQGGEVTEVSIPLANDAFGETINLDLCDSCLLAYRNGKSAVVYEV